MVRRQIQLTEEQAAALKRIATERGISVSELVREGVRRVISEARGPEWEERKRRGLAAVGRFHGPPDMSERHDDYFAESVVDPVQE